MKNERLGDYIEITNGFAFKSSEYSVNGARVIRITNVQKGEIKDNDPKFYPFKKTDNLNKYRIYENDILMSLTGNVGRVGRFPSELLPAYINQRICRVKSISKGLFDDYLYHILNSDKFEIEAIKASNGMAQLNLSTKWIEDFHIPLPSLSEQRRIAEILDKADALRQKNKQLLATYDELLQATFLDMFGDPATNPKGWKEVMLDSTIQKIQIGPFGSQLHKYDYLESGIPLINPTNIKGNKISIDEAACISEEKYDSMPQYHLFDGDVIMARRGDLSKVALVKQNGDRMFCGTGSLYVRFSDELNKFFLFKMLSHEKTINFLEKEARGVTMPNLNKSIIKRIPIFLPPIALQNQFAQIVENIEAQKKLVKQSLQESEDLFNGLVQKAFSGEL